MRKLLSLLLVVGLVLSVGLRGVRADELDDINRQIEELSQARQQSVDATKPLEEELGRLDDKLSSIEAGIAKAKEELRKLQASIAKREKDFTQQYVLLAERVASVYKSSRAPSSLMMMFVGGPGDNFARDLFYQQSVTDKDKEVITQITIDLIELEKDKTKAEADKLRLADLQAKLDKEADFFRGEIAGAKEYQASLSQEIATLSAKQQSIIAQKLSSLNLPQSLGAGALVCTDDRKIDPGFGNAFAFYTYGIPHRVGMNQYGAYGRAKAGQGYQDILRAYYDGISFEGGREGINLKVQGYGEMNLETYLLGIYEIPGDWPMESLKAQVVAARSYALAYTNNGANEICTTQACQVYKGGNKGGQWEQAVNQTKGQVMTNGGQVITAWYSSTDGGYTHTSGEVWGSNRAWTKNLRDTTGGVGSFSELNDKSYDKDSPCFYAAQGWRDKYNKSAWLTREEVADIANVILLVRKNPSTACFVYQVDKSPPSPDDVCPVTDNWSMEKVRQELGGEAMSSASSVEISGVNWGSGRTTQVRINGINFDGNEFKNYFNVRAPANIQIVGPLYNVEKR